MPLRLGKVSIAIALTVAQGIGSAGCDGSGSPSQRAEVRLALSGEPIILATGMDRGGSIAVDSENVYWFARYPTATGFESRLSQISVDGGVPITLASYPGGTDTRHVAIDQTHVYFCSSDLGGSHVMKIPIGGGPPTDLTDPIARTCGEEGRIHVGNYFVHYMDSSGFINAVFKGGGGDVNINGTGPQSAALAFTADEATVYWLNADPAWLLSAAPASGGSATTLVPNVGAASPWTRTDLYELGGALFWGTNTSSIYTYPILGGPITALVSGEDVYSYITVDSTSIYWQDKAADGFPIRKVSASGGTPVTVVPAGVATNNCMPHGESQLAVGPEYVYWLNPPNLYKAPKDPAQTGTVNLAVSVVDAPDPVATSGVITYQVTVRNLGTATEGAVAVQGRLSGVGSFDVSAPISLPGGTCTLSATAFSCLGGALVGGASAESSASARVRAAKAS